MTPQRRLPSVSSGLRVGARLQTGDSEPPRRPATGKAALDDRGGVQPHAFAAPAIFSVRERGACGVMEYSLNQQPFNHHSRLRRWSRPRHPPRRSTHPRGALRHRGRLVVAQRSRAPALHPRTCPHSPCAGVWQTKAERPDMPLIVCVCGGPATRGTENAYRGGCTGRYDDGRTGLYHMYDASTTSASRSQISTS
jgi:hypothetical protein